MSLKSNQEQCPSGKPTQIPDKGDNQINESAWNTFAAFINSEGDSDFPAEPTDGDYLRKAPGNMLFDLLMSHSLFFRYFEFLWEVKNCRFSTLSSTFTRLKELHWKNYGNSIQEVWPKITMMCEEKKGVKKAVAKNVPEKSRQDYERTWKAFATFTEKGGDEEPTEDDYLRFFNYLAEVKKCKWSTLDAYFSRLNTGHQTRHGMFELSLQSDPSGW